MGRVLSVRRFLRVSQIQLSKEMRAFDFKNILTMTRFDQTEFCSTAIFKFFIDVLIHDHTISRKIDQYPGKIKTTTSEGEG